MEVFSELFSDELLFLDFPCDNKDDLFHKISQKLAEKNLVKESFLQAITDREEEFPTGLRSQPYQVAIPHTDPEHIKSPFIAFVRPAQAINFGEMGTDDEEVEVNFIFMLGLNRGQDQIILLQWLIDMFMKEDVMDLLREEKNPASILEILKKEVTQNEFQEE